MAAVPDLRYYILRDLNFSREGMMLMHSMKKYLLIILGSISLALGIIGILLPVLPTTPFLLLASFCYLKSSRRLYDWLISHKIFGPYIYNYITYNAVYKGTKIKTILFLWGTLILSSILVNSLPIRIFLVLMGIGVSIHLLRLKTIEKEEKYDS